MLRLALTLAPGDTLNVIAAPPSSQRIAILGNFSSADAAGSVQFKSYNVATTVKTAITGVIPVSTGLPLPDFVLPNSDTQGRQYALLCLPGEALEANVVTANIGGEICYDLVPAGYSG
jgi:hypothetical protein